VTVELHGSSEIVASTRREIGLRALGIRGEYLALESKRWVLRGVHADSTTAKLPRQWHETATGYVPTDASDELLSEASQFGALTIAEARGTPEEIAETLRRLSAFPAVAAALIRGNLPVDFKVSAVAPNLLLAQPLGRDETLNVQKWAHLLSAEADDPHFTQRIAAVTELPVIACRKLPQPLPLVEARAACDTLQRDLAPMRQFAGYVV
jgi:hypothetical protein